MIDKYQRGVFLTTCNSLTDAISNCLNIDSVLGHFISGFFFLVVAGACSL